MKRWLATVSALVLLAVVGGCGGNDSSGSSGDATSSSSGGASGKLLVFAATSLTGAFDKIGAQFEKANPGVKVTFNYDGSSTLATSIVHGAPADVFASAAPENMKTVTDENLTSGTPETFTSNKAEIMVETGNPKTIKSVNDLAEPDLKVVVCAPDVPCGALAQDIFKKAEVAVKPASEETSVGGVVTKMTLGEADAGMVYVTDVKANGNKTAGVPIPAEQNQSTVYPIAPLKDAPNAAAAKAFIDYVTGPKGQQVLATFGFQPPA